MALYVFAHLLVAAIVMSLLLWLIVKCLDEIENFNRCRDLKTAIGDIKFANNKIEYAIKKKYGDIKSFMGKFSSYFSKLNILNFRYYPPFIGKYDKLEDYKFYFNKLEEEKIIDNLQYLSYRNCTGDNLYIFPCQTSMKHFLMLCTKIFSKSDIFKLNYLKLKNSSRPYYRAASDDALMAVFPLDENTIKEYNLSAENLCLIINIDAYDPGSYIKMVKDGLESGTLGDTINNGYYPNIKFALTSALSPTDIDKYCLNEE